MSYIVVAKSATLEFSSLRDANTFCDRYFEEEGTVLAIEEKPPQLRQTLIDAYLDYYNNYHLVASFAEKHGISNEQACEVIRIGEVLCKTKHSEA